MSDDQDLLFATIPRPILTPFGPLWTDPRHFLAHNTYHGVAPFDLAVTRSVRLKLAGLPFDLSGPDRVARLDRAVERGVARLLISARRLRPFAAWRPLVEVQLVARLDLDQEALRFDPFANGRGVVPRGFVHHLRRATYAAGQRLRPASSPPTRLARVGPPRAPGLRAA